MTKIAIITGASSGIGKQAALTFQQAGYTVIGGARNIEHDSELKNSGIVTHPLDVTDHASNQAFIQYVLTNYHRIDVLVNAAGYGSFGALEEVPLSEARNQLEVNLLGIVDLIQLTIPTMRQQKAGKIINISSLAGQSYSALAGWYYISKHALETMSDVLRLELKPFGIDVVIVEPGITATNWAQVTNQHLLQVTPENSPYRQLAEKQAQMITQATQTAQEVAAVILKAAQAQRPKIRYQVKFLDKLAMNLVHFVGYRLQDWSANRMLR
ncbi:SDR family NAD(P)-dependent oxidoreductase [Loigolactobacillus binensis]|uniref:SDR family NAD(P)-dependent oxidoreductase n=1 Tax=Loigolactobacillus binensis TaxID=2559922 RepID=A0ABW3EDB5_9LACO|nr:SDR family NAD(P)-dependent oxidoreductase [Loigolactobacillus binensis]